MRWRCVRAAAVAAAAPVETATRREGLLALLRPLLQLGDLAVLGVEAHLSQEDLPFLLHQFMQVLGAVGQHRRRRRHGGAHCKPRQAAGLGPVVPPLQRLGGGDAVGVDGAALPAPRSVAQVHGETGRRDGGVGGGWCPRRPRCQQGRQGHL